MQTEFKPLSVDIPIITIPNLIVRIKPYFYGTKRDIHDPKCKIQVKADIWVTKPATPGSKSSISCRYPKYVDMIPRADVDLNKGEISKNGKVIQASNVKEVITLLKDSLC